ncbi:hypothetical protein GEMRC1_008669 [Eukaryota sp. GEM-RC1]
MSSEVFNDYNLDDKGSTSFVVDVSFPKVFMQIPKVYIFLFEYNSANTVLSYTTSIEAVDFNQFRLRVTTLENCRLSNISFYYIASTDSVAVFDVIDYLILFFTVLLVLLALLLERFPPSFERNTSYETYHEFSDDWFADEMSQYESSEYNSALLNNSTWVTMLEHFDSMKREINLGNEMSSK